MRLYSVKYDKHPGVQAFDFRILVAGGTAGNLADRLNEVRSMEIAWRTQADLNANRTGAERDLADPWEVKQRR